MTFQETLDQVMNEIIRKVNGKYNVYPKHGGHRLGSHATKQQAVQQLKAIEINKAKHGMAEDESHLFAIKRASDGFFYNGGGIWSQEPKLAWPLGKGKEVLKTKQWPGLAKGTIKLVPVSVGN